ncbi:MAG: energy transducer TonB [Myxococcota bacterium]|nr:energy transducer TonB [Myxococcota bacterium]
MARRYALAFLVASGVTFGLFYLMQSLISMGVAEAERAFAGQVIEFVRLKRDSQLELKKRRLPEKTPPEEEPPPPELDLSRPMRPDQNLDAMSIAMAHQVDMGGSPDFSVMGSDQDIVPIVRVNPQYPIRAADRGIQGWVEVQFTISAAGTVKNPVVVAAEPATIFNRAALRAIRKWKYSPKIEEGVAVDRPNVRVKLHFSLENEP